MADVFISYSQRDRQVAADLAKFLEQCGYGVWWDYNLVGGAKFRDEIKQELAKARAAIVIWTRDSSESDWVIDEADDAKRAKKLVPSRVDELDPANIPLGFRGIHTLRVKAPEEILKALEKLGVKPSRPPAPPETKPVTIGGTIDPESIAKAEQFAHWEFIKGSDDPLAFRSYVERFPTSSFVVLAKSRLDSLAKAAWQPLIVSDDIVALEHYVAIFPDDEHAKPAKLKLQGLKNRDEEEKSWQRIKESNGIAEVEEHINRFGGGFTAARAFDKLRELRRLRDARDRWNSIGSSTDIELLDQFIQAYGETDYAALARQRIEDIHRAREERDWNAVRNERHPAPCLGFLRDHPSGAHTNEALALLEAMPRAIEEEAWAIVKDSNEPLLHQAFSVALPHSRYAKPASGPNPGGTAISEVRPRPGRLKRFGFWLLIVVLASAVAMTTANMTTMMRLQYSGSSGVAISAALGALLTLLIACALRWITPRLYPSLSEGGNRQTILLHSLGCLVIVGWMALTQTVAEANHNRFGNNIDNVLPNSSGFYLGMIAWIVIASGFFALLGRFRWPRYAAYTASALAGTVAVIDRSYLMSGGVASDYWVTASLSFYGGVSLVAFNAIAIVMDLRPRRQAAA